jgi:signal peptidase
MIKKICNVLSTVLLLVLALVAAALIIPRILGYGQYAVLSGSMEPKIHVGAIVYDKAADTSELEVGDIITYQLSSETLVTHRITAINASEGTVTTKGDANDSEDGAPVPYSNIVGKYAFNIPYLGYITIYGRTPLGIGVICGILVLLILLNFLPDALSGDEKESAKQQE